MSITTTESIKQQPSSCDVCGRPAPLARLVGADGKSPGFCCATPRQAVLLLEMNPDWTPPEDMAHRIAVDALNMARPGEAPRFPWGLDTSELLPAELLRGPGVPGAWTDADGGIAVEPVTHARRKRGLVGTD